MVGYRPIPISSATPLPAVLLGQLSWQYCSSNSPESSPLFSKFCLLFSNYAWCFGTPIILKLCLMLWYPYYSQNYASIFPQPLIPTPWNEDISVYSGTPLFQPPEMRTPLYTVEPLYSNPLKWESLCIQWNPLKWRHLCIIQGHLDMSQITACTLVNINRTSLTKI